MWTRDFSESGRGVWGCVPIFFFVFPSKSAGRVHGPSGRVRVQSVVSVVVVVFFVLQVSGVKVRESGVKKLFPSHASEWKCVSAGLCSAQKSAVHTSGKCFAREWKILLLCESCVRRTSPK